jgi:hypothetical protein
LRIADFCKTIPTRGSWEPDDRIALAMASCSLAKAHHDSIHLLHSHNKDISARALARPLLEAGLRTLRVVEKASDSEIVDVLKGKENMPRLGGLIKSLKSVLSDDGTEVLSGRHRGLLDSLTHGGSRALAAQFLDDGVLRKGNAAMVAQAGIALGAARYAIARQLGRTDLAVELSDAIPQRG